MDSQHHLFFSTNSPSKDKKSKYENSNFLGINTYDDNSDGNSLFSNSSSSYDSSFDFTLGDIDETPQDKFNKHVFSTFTLSLGSFNGDSNDNILNNDKKIFSSIVDPQRDTLAPDVWDIYSETPVLLDKYYHATVDRLGDFLQNIFKNVRLDYVVGVYVISSIGTYHYNDLTDFDIKVIIDQNKFFDYFPRLKKFPEEDILSYLIKNARESDIMTSPLPGSKRKFDWYFYMVDSFNQSVLNSSYRFDSIYDVLNRKWLKLPIKRSFEDDVSVLQYAIKLASKLFESFDEKFGRIRRNTLLYLELSEYIKKISPKSFDIRKKLFDVVYSLGKDLNLLNDDKEFLQMLRDKSVGENEMMNIFSKKFKSSNYNDGNLIRKILEKFGYWYVLVQLSKINKENPVIDPEKAKEIKEIIDYGIK